MHVATIGTLGICSFGWEFQRFQVQQVVKLVVGSCSVEASRLRPRGLDGDWCWPRLHWDVKSDQPPLVDVGCKDGWRMDDL